MSDERPETTWSEQARAQALQFLEERREKAKRDGQVKNEDLPAGSEMRFYCGNCGILVDVLPELYLFPPYTTCSQCKGLEENPIR